MRALLSFPILRPLLPLKPYRHPKPSPVSAAAGAPAMAKPLHEADVGISCYVSSIPGFHGILKQRYSDFIVNEVDLDGNTIHLTSFDLPQENPEDKEEEGLPASERSYTDEIESFRLLSGDADADSLKVLLEKVQSDDKSDIPPIVLLPDADKSHRAEVHNFFKKCLKFLVTDTVEAPEGDSKCIRVRLSANEGGGRRRRGMQRKGLCDLGSRYDRPFDSRGSDNWPKNLGKFLRFHLYKENKNTQEALGVIAKLLGIQQRSFGIAGTKDKRSISTQRVTVFKQHAKRLAALNSRLLGIKVGDFCYVREEILLGQLLGNHFTLTLRGVVADTEDIIKEAVVGVGKNGFINYYGLQRFGSGSVPTHIIGASLLRGEWKSAVDLILDPREGEHAAIREARETYKKSGNTDLALRQLPRHLVAERTLLQNLKKCPGNYLQALIDIPRTLRMMYVHSYQSYLWNHAATKRVQKHGISEVVLGDLVISSGGSSRELLSNSEPEDAYTDRDNSIVPDRSDATLPEENVQDVKVVNSEDLLLGGYTFEDVVLPLPGSRIIYPENDIAGMYHDMAKKDGINLTESTHGAKEFSITRMTGDYRRIFQRPVDITWELLTYMDSNIPLTETDVDISSKTRPADIYDSRDSCCQPENGTAKLSLAANCATNSKDESEENLSTIKSAYNSSSLSPKMALKLGFTLPASSYATMAIRELLKSSTSVIYQKVISR